MDIKQDRLKRLFGDEPTPVTTISVSNVIVHEDHDGVLVVSPKRNYGGLFSDNEIE